MSRYAQVKAEVKRALQLPDSHEMSIPYFLVTSNDYYSTDIVVDGKVRRDVILCVYVAVLQPMFLHVGYRRSTCLSAATLMDIALMSMIPGKINKFRKIYFKLLNLSFSLTYQSKRLWSAETSPLLLPYFHEGEGCNEDRRDQDHENQPR